MNAINPAPCFACDGIRRWVKRVFSACLFSAPMLVVAAPMTVAYVEPGADYRYPVELLDLALRKSGVAYRLQANRTPMLQGRALKQLATGKLIDVVWTMTSRERESELTPIRIPIDKGLLGWRIFLIKKQNAPRFANIQSLADLQQLQAGQGHDWPDTEILRANGINVQGYSVFENLFNMLEFGRFDYFPRSIMEIWAEEKSHAHMDLAVEQSVVLHYPTAYYFFVNKNNHTLAHAIEHGLHIAIKDGSFDSLFNKTYGDVVQRTRLHARKRFELTNPLLPPLTPLAQKELWLNL